MDNILKWQKIKNAYNIIGRRTLTVMSTHVINLLTSTLDPSQLESSQREIQRTRTNQGFATHLMMIADNNNYDIKIRQSALIVLKNMVYDRRLNGSGINQADYDIVKGSILDALARQWGNKHLTPILREIIHIIADIDFPSRWPEILPAILHNINQSSDYNSVASSVEALKAIASVCGHAVQEEVTLNNFANQIVIPLFELANKLFANYSPETQTILVSIFKIFNLVLFYHIPIIFINNIHSLMVFCKKIIDLQIDQMGPLKIACLKILTRLYSRHTTSSIPYKLLKFSQQFHNKYTVLMTESFIGLLMDSSNNGEIVNYSLMCLTCIYKYNEQASMVIDKYYQQIIELCLNRYKIQQLRSGQSVGSFITHIKEERNGLIDFITALFNGNDKILGVLIQFLKKGDEKTQQLVLYIFGGLSEEIQDCPQLHQSMSSFIICFILPILSGQSSTIMKARGCEIISSYKYIELPAQNLQQIFQFVYSCLTQAKDSYLNVYALEAFTQLICKYDSFMELIVPYLQDILNVYTNLMKESNGEVEQVISSFQLFLKHLNGNHIKDCAIDLVKFLTALFYEYHEQNTITNVRKNSDENDELLSEAEEDGNQIEAKDGCLACIREILAIDNLPVQIYPTIIQDCILPLSVTILSDKSLLHFEECLNILNLCLYKSEKLPNNFQQFFKIFTYAIITIPSELGQANLSNQYKQILTNVCVDPDQDLVQNVVGFFRNFIAKAQGQLRNLKDELGTSFMEYIFRIVQHVEQATNNNNPAYKKSDQAHILTLYTSLLQYQFLQPQQFQLIVSNLLNWLSGSTSSQAENNVYIETILICVYYNIELTLSKVNVEWLLNEILQRLPVFKLEYQLSRLVLGVSRMLQKQVLKNEQTATNLIKCLPDIVLRLIQQRIKEENQANPNPQQKQQQEQIDLEEQAEQDLIGDNTHLGLLPKKSDDREKEAELKQFEQAEWDEEYNKFYHSPFMAINQLDFLVSVLKNSGYTGLLSNPEQQKLTQYICNAPPKSVNN